MRPMYEVHSAKNYGLSICNFCNNKATTYIEDLSDNKNKYFICNNSDCYAKSVINFLESKSTMRLVKRIFKHYSEDMGTIKYCIDNNLKIYCSICHTNKDILYYDCDGEVKIDDFYFKSKSWPCYEYLDWICYNCYSLLRKD